jgi:hypothetical protein
MAKMGRKLKPIDENLVKKLALIHCTMIEIAQICECSVDTLERRFADVINFGRANGKMSIRRKQYEVAMAGNPVMLKWLGQNLLGQKDVKEIEQVQPEHERKKIDEMKEKLKAVINE